MKIVIAPDSFKGTMSAVSVCESAKKALSDRFPDAEIVCVPVADGGEGTVDSFCTALKNAVRKTYRVTDLFGRVVDADVCMSGKTAVIETASAAGLDLTRLDVLHATTFGLGTVIKYALEDGAEEMVLGLGGSGTTDCGIGLAGALGVRFYDKNDKEIRSLCGDSLDKIERIDLSGLDNRIKKVRARAACDVQIPLYGPTGTAMCYSRQKGATPEQMTMLDNGLRHFAELVKKQFGEELNVCDGSGAAGGIGAAVKFFLGGELVPGIDLVLTTVDFDGICKDADVVITGEGCADRQSLSGKVPVGVAAVAKRHGCRVICLCGKRGDGWEELLSRGIDDVVCINRDGVTFEDAKRNCYKYLAETLKVLEITK